MKQYKRIKTLSQTLIGLSIVCVFTAIFIAGSRLKADTGAVIPDSKFLHPSSITKVPTLFDRGLEFLEYFLGSIAVIAVWVSAIQFALADGAPEKVAKAKRSLIFALIGVFLSVLSFAITTAVFKMTQ